MTTVESKLVLDGETRRKISVLAYSGASISWEQLEDLGLFCMFEHLPSQDELKKLLAGSTVSPSALKRGTPSRI